MTEDARFEDGREAPLNLGALDAEDLTVIASLTQDAVFPASEMRWHRTGACGRHRGRRAAIAPPAAARCCPPR